VPEGNVLEVTIEPTGASWLPVAVFFARRSHVVHRVSSAMRRFLSQHTKANSIAVEEESNDRHVPALLEPLVLTRSQHPSELVVVAQHGDRLLGDVGRLHPNHRRLSYMPFSTR